MVEGILKQLIKKKEPQRGWIVQSAGTWGESDLPASQNAMMVLKTRGIDLNGHKSKIISTDLIEQADLILTMEGGHKEALQIEFPLKKDKIIQFSELIEEEFDIEDPMGQPMDRFERTAKEIEMLLDKGFERLSTLLGNSTS